MLKVKEKWASLFIPKRTPYCYIPKNHIKPSKKYPYGGFKIKPCRYWCMKHNKEYGYKMEYCKFLKGFLDIQDQVKDCGINDDYDEIFGKGEE